MKTFRQFLLERGERDTFARTEGLRIWRRLREILADKDLPETKYKWTSRGELGLYLPDLDHSFPSLYVVLDFASSGNPSGYGTVRGTNKPVIRIAKVLLNPYDWTYIETRMSGLEDTWVHEFTHHVDALDNPASNGVGTHYDDDNEEWLKRYYNHPSEVRAYTNELLFRLEQFFNSRSPELRAHSREKASRPDHVIQWLIGQYGTRTFQEWWKYLTEDNKRRVYKLIAAFLDDHKLSEAFLMESASYPTESVAQSERVSAAWRQRRDNSLARTKSVSERTPVAGAYYYHTTLEDNLDSIMKRGLIPGASVPSGQDWAGDYSGKGIYLHQAFPHHEQGEGVVTLEVYLGAKTLGAFRPDEDSGHPPTPEGTRAAFLDGSAVVVLAKVPPMSLRLLR